jgi:hypothetical protein
MPLEEKRVTNLATMATMRRSFLRADQGVYLPQRK